MVTVHDVAARSGVSIATVSRALREPHRVSGDTRDRVLDAVRELGYRPNRAASGLRRGRTGVIALVVPDIENPYFASLTKGVQASSRASGYGLVVVDTTEEATVEAEEIRALRSQIDGMIVASSRLPESQLSEVVGTTICVLINRSILGAATPTVTIDEVTGTRAAIDHLHALGHTSIAYVGGPVQAWSQARRLAGLRDAASLYPGVRLVEIGNFAPDAGGGRAAADRAADSGATAVIAYNDLVALGLLARWAERGVRVPDDLSLVGFDNTSVTELSSPRLTSVGVDLREFGEAAARLLLERVDGGIPAGPRDVELPPRLVVRASTAAPRAE